MEEASEPAAGWRLADRMAELRRDGSLDTAGLVARLTSELLGLGLEPEPLAGGLDRLLWTHRPELSEAEAGLLVDAIETPQAVCSYCFKDGDLVWNCRDCQVSEPAGLG